MSADKLIVTDSKGQPLGELNAAVSGPKRRRYYFPGGFSYMGLTDLSKLAHTKLPADAYRLALLLVEAVGYAGVCARPHTYFAAELGVDKSRVSKLLRMLEKLELLRRLGGSSLLISPLFCHRGTPEEQLAALDHWRQVTEPYVTHPSQLNPRDRPLDRPRSDRTTKKSAPRLRHFRTPPEL